MKTVSINIKDSIFEEAEKLISRLKIPMNTYINDGLEHYNQFQKRLLLGGKHYDESDLENTDSLTLLEEFEGFDYAY